MMPIFASNMQLPHKEEKSGWSWEGTGGTLRQELMSDGSFPKSVDMWSMWWEKKRAMITSFH
jgi:hypothetical protein